MRNEAKGNIEQSFRPIVGIDLGTTNSAVAYIHNGKPEILPDKEGNPIIPSVVLIDPSGKAVVGETARASLVAMPERTKAAVKREMGSETAIHLAGKAYFPEEISAFILKEMKEAADSALGEGEKEAIITVPAYFTDEQRKATKRAGELAGFIVERIINEPTAAALAFGFNHLKEDRHLVVYDLGGGTFDVSVVEIMDGIIEVKASSGNNKLGGEDFDWLLVDWMAGKIVAKDKVDPRKDVRGLALLKEEAESIKKQLSTEKQVKIALPVVVMRDEQPIGLYETITQETFLALIEPLLKETILKVSEVIEEANIKTEHVDDILLVGGSTRIPRVKELITEFFGLTPRNDIHPEEAVAIGAAVQSGLKSGAISDSGLIVTDVAPFSMGIAFLKELRSGKSKPGAYKAIIDKNTTIPVTRTETFYTATDGQTVVKIEVYQGEQKWVKDNHFLNAFNLEGIPPGPASSESIEVTFRYNLNGILEVTAKSVSTEKSMTVTLEDAIDRSSEKAFQKSIEKIKAADNAADMEEFDQQDIFSFLEEDDDEELDLDDLLAEAKQWEKRCRRSLKDAEKDERNALRKVIEVLKAAIEEEDSDDLEEAIDKATDLYIELEI